MSPVVDNSNLQHVPRVRRNIIFIGETGSGKSSVINLLLRGDANAPVSNDSPPCTRISACHYASLYGHDYNLWDTPGLGEGRNVFQAIFGRGSQKGLRRFLKERYHKGEIDLLVFCVKGSRAVKAWVKYYQGFCAITRHLVAPVVIAVTHLEREEVTMEDWWKRNMPKLLELGLEFDGHVCITALNDHPRRAESVKRLSDLIVTRPHWEAKGGGIYFGLPVPLCPGREREVNWNIFKLKYALPMGSYFGLRLRKSDPLRNTKGIDGNTPFRPKHNPPSTSTISVLRIDTNLPASGNRFQTDTYTESPLRAMSYTTRKYISGNSSRRTSGSTHLDVRLSCMEENEGYPSDLRIKNYTAMVKRRRKTATYADAFADIWECDLISKESTLMVAVKVLKTSHHQSSSSHKMNLRRALRTWGRLRHTNIVPLLGVVSGFGPLPSLANPWFTNGDLSTYIAAHAELTLHEKYCLLADMATGLCYLHNNAIVHGNLHSGNVLIDDDGTARLTDFVSSLTNKSIGTSYMEYSICGDLRFVDPSLVQRAVNSLAVVHPTKHCDVYSFGGLVLHVLSGKEPYDEVQWTSLFELVFKGERPKIPTHLHITQSHKSVIQKCWDRDEPRRPRTECLRKTFIRLITPPTPW